MVILQASCCLLFRRPGGLSNLICREHFVFTVLYFPQYSDQYSDEKKVTSIDMAPEIKLMCEQFSMFSQIILVGVFIIQSSLIIVELFLLLRFNKLRELEDYLAFMTIKLRILYASTKVTYSSRLIDILICSFQLYSLQSFNEVYKSLQIL
ncbi:Hypothetical_protein [Hexamita inflata]|uniref:Hypothetical_protein n=1 Tax=Hexamita inflata TaxID=28002 RepID=A0AA86VRN4_9EUKA|nr:Hypothetical protein HINF_LOCUS62403 [Hexamita inflata]